MPFEASYKPLCAFYLAEAGFGLGFRLGRYSGLSLLGKGFRQGMPDFRELFFERFESFGGL